MQCDLARPVCSRCARLKHQCFGYTADVDFAFRSENVVAQRNSERARRKPVTTSMTLSVRPDRGSKSVSPPFVDISGQLAGTEHPWLQQQAYKSVPTKIDRLVIDRAVERFFHDWITVPGDKGVAVGHLAQIPSLYMSSPQQTAFRTMIEAGAYAHLQYEKDDGQSFNVKARATYGRALKLMKEEVSRKHSAKDIRLMASLLLFDNFESLNLGRAEILGPHTHGVKHILAEMTEEQYESPLGYILWKVAYTRLLARQLINRQSPATSQLRWVKYIGSSRPDLFLLMICVKFGTLIGQARELEEDVTDMKVNEKLEQAQLLLQAITATKATSSAWLAKLPPGWLSRQKDGAHPTIPSAWVPPSRHGPLPIHHALFHDMQLAFALNFYQTTLVVVHESNISLYRMMKSLSAGAEAAGIDASIAAEIQTVVVISNTIMSTFPGFVEMARKAGGKRPERSQDKAAMAGRFFAMYSMPIFLRSEHVPEEHKFVARWLMDSISVDYNLEDID